MSSARRSTLGRGAVWSIDRGTAVGGSLLLIISSSPWGKTWRERHLERPSLSRPSMDDKAAASASTAVYGPVDCQRHLVRAHRHRHRHRRARHLFIPQRAHGHGFRRATVGLRTATDRWCKEAIGGLFWAVGGAICVAAACRTSATARSGSLR